VIGKRIRKEEGAVAVEFAIIMILLFMILFGIIEFGITINRYQMYVGAAREGARFAAVRCRPDVTTGCTNTLIQDRMANSMACTPACTPSEAFFPEIPTADKVCGDPTAGQEVTISWNQHFSIQIPFVPDLSFDKDVKGVFRCE
jgi:Flp pilus assembly protein TadG